MPLGAARINGLSKVIVTVAANVVRRKLGISALGNAQVDTAQSKFGGASALFDGTGDYLTVLPANFDFTTDFTIECFVRLNAKATKNSFFTFYNGATYRFHIAHESNNDYGFVYYNANSGAVLDSLAGSLGYAATNTAQWYHVALVRSGNTFTLYVDGTSRDSVTQTPTISVDTCIIGAESNGTLSLNGWLDEVRISNTARYTANFTPSTTPFVNDDYTNLLLHMDGTDASTFFEDDNGVRAKKGVTAVGNAQIDTAQSKFGGSSALFDGTGDYLTVETPIVLGSNNFTFECWIRRDDTVTDHIIVDFRDAEPQVAGVLYASNQTLIWYVNGSARITTGNVLTSTSVFYHIAISRSGTETKLFVDGTQQGSTYSDSNNYLGPKTRIGAAYTTGSSDYDGWIDEVRISNTARYTANFTAPSAAFTNDANTLLLLHMDGTDASTVFRDDNGDGRTPKNILPVANAQIDTAQYKFGGAAALFDGTGDYLEVKNSFSWHANSTGTIEFFFRLNSTVPFAQGLFSQTIQGASTGFQLLTVTNQLYYYKSPTTGALVWSTTLVANTWYHIAVVKESSTVTKIYVDGTLRYTDSSSSGFTDSTSNFWISRGMGISSGLWDSVRYDLNGWIDEFRISSSARYSGNFTPTTTPFQNDSDTLLLLHLDGTDAATVIIDDNGDRQI